MQNAPEKWEMHAMTNVSVLFLPPQRQQVLGGRSLLLPRTKVIIC